MLHDLCLLTFCAVLVMGLLVSTIVGVLTMDCVFITMFSLRVLQWCGLNMLGCVLLCVFSVFWSWIVD